MTFIPGKRHPFHFLGLKYSQFYSSTKELFDASKVFAFDTKLLEELAVDPNLHRLWNQDMSHAATSKDRPRIQNAYIAAKQCVMEALWSS